MLKTLTIEGSSWLNEDGRVVNRIDLKPIAKVWVKFLKSRLMHSTHTTTVSHERLILLYVILKGLTIDVGKIIKREIRECAMKKQKTVILLFPSLITNICVVFGVKISAKDEKIKNKRALMAGTLERITGKIITVAILEHVAVIRTGKVTCIERKLQELSDNINDCEATRRK